MTPCDLVDELLRDHEVDHAVGGIQFAERRNVLMKATGTITVADITLITLQVFQPEGFGYHERHRQHLNMPEMKVIGESHLLWNSDQPALPFDRLVWGLKLQNEQFLTGNLHLGYVFDKKSTWTYAPQPEVSQEIKLLELFSGAFGGWKGGAKFLETQTSASFQTVSVDHDISACQTFALSHSVNLVKSSKDIPEDLFATSIQSWVVCADAKEPELLRPLTKWSPIAASMSAPCPPWCNTGAGGGLNRAEGLLFVQVLLFLRWLQVTFIMIEQVAAFANHAHFRIILQIIHLLGYKLAWSKTADNQDVSRVVRSRWLALLVRVNANVPNMPAQFWSRLDRRFMPDPHMDLPLEHREAMQLQADAIAVASNPQYLMFHGKRVSGFVHMNVIGLRTYNGGTIPTVLARYGTQHWLSEQLLQDQGYLGHFARDSTAAIECRHWHPAEIALMHGVVQPCFLPNDHFIAWFGLGNMITIQHSILVLAQMLNRCMQEQVNVAQVIEAFAEAQMKPRASQMIPIIHGYMVCQKFHELPEAFVNSAHELQQYLDMHGHTFWSPQFGIQEFQAAHWTLATQPTAIDSDVDELPAHGFSIFPGTIHFTTHSSKFWFAGNLPGESIRALWNHQFTAKFSEFGSPSMLDLTFCPTDVRPSSVDECGLVLIDSKLTLMLCQPVPIVDQPHLTGIADHLYDQFGLLGLTQKANSHTILLSQQLPEADNTMDFVHVLGAFNSLIIQWSYDIATDVLTCQTQGPLESQQIWSMFWTSMITPQHSQILGRQAIHAADTDQAMFEPMNQGVCPPQAFRLALTVLAARNILNGLPQLQVDEILIPVTIKLHGRPLWTGNLPIALPLSIVFGALRVAMNAFWGTIGIRLLCHGKQIMPEFTLKDYLRDSDESVNLRLGHVLTGGGAKDQQRRVHQSAIASVLLEQGHALQWVTPTVETILAKISHAKVNQITSMPMGAPKIAAIEGLCRESGVPLQAPVKPQSQKEQPGAPWNKQKRSRQHDLNPAEFTLLPGFFLNADDSKPMQIQSIRAQATGLCIMHASQAAAWLREGSPISSDELGLLVLGKMPDTTLPKTSITFPCSNGDGAMVLLHGHLVQLGGKAIKCKSDNQNIPSDTCQLLAVTMYKEDFDAQTWKDAVQNPAAMIRRILRDDQLDTSITAIWGRSLRQGRSPASPIQATSVQVHCTADKAKTAQLLKQSGFNKLFLTPKQASGKIGEDYLVIWIGNDSVKATSASAQVTACMGLIRGRNGALGLRFERSAYQDAWQTLCPGMDMPKHSPADQLYKIQNLPFGCSHKMIADWSQKVGWNNTPHKALGPTAWLVRSNSQPADTIHLFNGNPVLITKIEQKAVDRTQVLVGPRSKAPATDPLMAHDPWNHGQPQRAHGPATPPATRALDGPMESKFKAHDDQIARIQTELAALTKAQEQQSQKVEERFQAAELREQQNAQHVRDTLRKMQQANDKSLQQTMANHTKAMDQQFSELRKLFLQTKRKSPMEEDDDMGNSWLGVAQTHRPALEMNCIWQLLGPMFCFFQLCRQSLRAIDVLRSQFTGCLHLPVLHLRLLFWILLTHQVILCHADPASAVSPRICQFVNPVVNSQPLFPLDSLTLQLLSGRVGEAANPGPSSFRIAIVNPTSILSKEQEFQQLRTQHHVHLVAAAETSATARAQSIFQQKIAKSYSRIVWSTPAPDKRERSDGEISLRGHATGVAALSAFPIRAAKETIPAAWHQTGRIVHAVVAIGRQEFQVVVVYAYTPGGHSNATTLNSQLVHTALDAITYMPLPAIILGDFNGIPFQWEVGARLRAQGFQDLTRLHTVLHQKDMPPTCRDVTRPDNALMCPQAAAMVSQIQVHRDFMFDCHSPVFVDLQIDLAQQQQQRLVMPKTFLDLPIDLTLLNPNYHYITQQHGPPQSLEAWGQHIEHALDLAYRQTQQQSTPTQPTRGLPKPYRGRCQPQVMKTFPMTALLRPARPGDYNPMFEIHTFLGQRMVKQTRRLQCVMRGLQKMPLPRQSILAGWKACLKDTAFSGNFVAWCLDTPELGPPAMDFPTLDYVSTAYQLAKHETNAKLHADHQIWKAKTAYRRHLDGQQGHRAAFSMLKQFQPPVTELQQQVQQTGMVVKYEEHSEIYFDDGTAFQVGLPVAVGSAVCTVHSQDEFSITVKPPITHSPSEPVTQTQSQYTPADIAAKLNEFWDPFWNVADPESFDQTQLQQLLNQVPPQLLANTPMPTLQDWLDTVRRLNRRSARGVDGISAAEIKELPTLAIEHLKTICESYEEGFPSWLMLAKTVPIPKVKGPLQASQVRPITILAQTFRLWSQVFSRAIIREMGKVFPADITGFLPGRGPLDACYEQQRAVETAYTTSTPTSGCNMDLIKCFNTIRRKIPLKVLTHLGIPDGPLRQWELSMRHLQRTWCLQEFVSPPVGVNNGVCEGDPFSVAAMLSLGHLWVQNVKHSAPTCQLSAYADNWAWRTAQPSEHASIAAVTIEVTAIAGMSVDWAKSWVWSTSSAHLPSLKRALEPFAGRTQVQHLLHSMDLGCVMHYKGTHRLGKYAQRIKEGIRRLQMLASLPHDLPTKAKLAKVGIFPQAFYGAELMPLGSQHALQFRNQLATGLLGKSASRNSAIAVACTPGLLDPEVYLIFQAIRSARRYLSRSRPEEIQAFCQTVARHNGQWTKCHGPAGSLRFYLDKLGWSCDAQGRISVSAFIHLSLQHTGLATFRKWLQNAWQQQLLPSYCSRQELRGMPPVALADTQQIIRQMPATQQHSILNEVAGAFQTHMQQAAWDPNETGHCPFCQAPDTRYHRVFECTVTATVRVPYLATLNWYQTEGSLIHELPAIFQHEDAEWLSTVFHTMSLPVPGADLLQFQTQRPQGQPLVFYTDGSCQNQSEPTTRHAGLAVVADLSDSPEQRQYEATQAAERGILPPSLHLAMASLLPGEQNILRAELAAIAWVCQHFDDTDVWTDSQVALTYCQKILNGVPLHVFASAPDYDILVGLWPSLQRGTRRFFKIKAHVPLEQFSGEALFHQLGNSMANDAAQATTTHGVPTLIQQIQQHHTYNTLAKQHLRKLYEFHLVSHKQRISAEKQNTDQPQQVRVVSRQYLVDYEPVHFHAIPDVQYHQLDTCAFGPTFARKCLEWMKQVKWPTVAQPHSDLGITWIELTLSFCLHSNVYVPIKRPDQHGKDRLVFLQNMQDVDKYTARLNEMTFVFTVLVHQILELVAPAIWPDIKRGMVKSLYVQGASCQCTGFQIRPGVPKQIEMLAVLREYLQSHKGPSFQVMPLLPVQTDLTSMQQFQMEHPGDWLQSCRKTHMAIRKVKQWRQRMKGQQTLTFWLTTAFRLHFHFHQPRLHQWWSGAPAWFREKGYLGLFEEFVEGG